MHGEKGGPGAVSKPIPTAKQTANLFRQEMLASYSSSVALFSSERARESVLCLVYLGWCRCSGMRARVHPLDIGHLGLCNMVGASYTWNVGSILLSCQQGPAPGAHRHLIDTYTVVCAHHLAPFFIWVTVELLSGLNARSLCWLHGEQVVCAGHGLVGWHGCLQLLIQKYTKRRLVFPLYFFLPSFLLSFFKRKK
jgi:hypothetical protein